MNNKVIEYFLCVTVITVIIVFIAGAVFSTVNILLFLFGQEQEMFIPIWVSIIAFLFIVVVLSVSYVLYRDMKE